MELKLGLSLATSKKNKSVVFTDNARLLHMLEENTFVAFIMKHPVHGYYFTPKRALKGLDMVEKSDNRAQIQSGAARGQTRLYQKSKFYIFLSLP